MMYGKKPWGHIVIRKDIVEGVHAQVNEQRKLLGLPPWDFKERRVVVEGPPQPMAKAAKAGGS